MTLDQLLPLLCEGATKIVIEYAPLQNKHEPWRVEWRSNRVEAAASGENLAIVLQWLVTQREYYRAAGEVNAADVRFLRVEP